MAAPIAVVPVTGTWHRHVPAGVDPLARPAVIAPGRFNPPGLDALYLAGDQATMWAEWYRHLAEREIPPTHSVPRDAWRLAVLLQRVADLSTPARLAALGLRPPRPSVSDWPAFQALGANLAGDGWQGVLFTSAARPQGRTLCVFRDVAPLTAVRAQPPPTRHDQPPPPPRGLRTLPRARTPHRPARDQHRHRRFAHGDLTHLDPSAAGSPGPTGGAQRAAR